MTTTVSTDGSALGNPNGPMGWAWADHSSQGEHAHTGDCDAGGATNGTNQIGELCAVLMALRAHPGSEPLVIETDSQYAINCSTKWVHGWKKNGWKNSKKEPVKNADVIKAIDAELRAREGSVRFQWVKGHAGNAGNEKVDELARTYAEDCRSGVRDGYLPREGWQSLLDSPYARGTDVPMDAQLLLDGELDRAKYVAGRCMGGAPEESAEGAENIVPAAAEPHDTDVRASRPGEAAHAKSASGEPAHNTAPVRDTAPTQTAVAAQPALRHSGLHVGGAVRFTPPPESSPHFDGRPRRVRGYIEVDGLVDGDGTLTLDDAPFLVYQS
ncbi:ribonuclease H [Bifidobacterium pseudolongum subsp. pseudolongum]|uniref:ribonuclease H family protein n=1 Tax=Bifidobacterium pseudolongum TaxID=1694 RepID=UPI000C7114B8|nr:ribonuclease H [Bifidobacterium pseudolongum]PKV08906.1 ribonuclease H [Bifidobacterium pseudolongum subsp. pseudolongum]